MALVELRAHDLALLRSVHVAPGPGFTVLTGETGAGKTLCITALRLAMGERVDGELIRPGAEAAGASAVFDDIPSVVRAQLEAHGIPDDDLVTLSRELSRSGRGASRVNGALVSQTTLRAIGDGLVEVTAQGESHRLLRPARQRALLDAFGGEAVAAARTMTATAVLAWREAENALQHAVAGAAASAAELAEAREVIAELEPLRLRSGEDAELAAECRRLRAAAALQAAMEAVRLACSGGEDSRGAADMLAQTLARGRPLHGVHAGVDAVFEACATAAEQLRDLGAQARTTADVIEIETGRLAEVELRLDLLDRVRRRHAGSLEAAIAALVAAQQTMAVATAGSGSIAAATTARDARRAEAGIAAAALTRHRRAAAERLERAVTAELRKLRLPRARFDVHLGSTPDAAGVPIDGQTWGCSGDGVDGVEFSFCASASSVPLPLDEGVSGGELSRVALALRAVVAVADDSPTVVLDEVDAGLGGETAARVGEALAAIGRQRQLLVVTHRPEIAARADHHVLLSRQDGPAGAEATATTLVDEERPTEIARLMSGRATAAAVARAVELLAEGGRVGPADSVRTMAR